MVAESRRSRGVVLFRGSCPEDRCKAAKASFFNFLLVAFLACNIFHAFLARNVKPAVRQSKTQIFWAKLIAAELYCDLTPAGMPP